MRHIILSDFKEKVPLAPFVNRETEPILMYDPLPPTDSINIYKRPTMSSGSRILPDASPLSMFFQSLLPNFNVQEEPFGGNAAVAEVNRHREALNDLLAGEEGSFKSRRVKIVLPICRSVSRRSRGRRSECATARGIAKFVELSRRCNARLFVQHPSTRAGNAQRRRR